MSRGKCVVFQRLLVLVPLSMSANVTLERHYFTVLASLSIFQTISFWCLFLTSLYFSNSILVSILFSTVFFLSFTLEGFFFPFSSLFSYLCCLFSYVYCNVCVLLICGFLSSHIQFVCHVISDYFWVNDSISQTATGRNVQYLITNLFILPQMCYIKLRSDRLKFLVPVKLSKKQQSIGKWIETSLGLGWGRGPWSGEQPGGGVCWLSWCKQPHHGRFQASDMALANLWQ